MPKKADETLEGEVTELTALQLQLTETEAELMQIEAFQKFVNLQKAVNDRMAQVRKSAETVLIPAYVAGEIDKSIKRPWGSVTITERDDFDIDEAALPPKFWKKVPDTTKIRKTFQLEGKEPKGTSHVKKYGVMMKFNKEES